jgi:hypothetical protein
MVVQQKQVINNVPSLSMKELAGRFGWSTVRYVGCDLTWLSEDKAGRMTRQST